MGEQPVAPVTETATLLVRYDVDPRVLRAVDQIEDWAGGLTVVDDTSASAAAGELRKIVDTAKRLEDARKARKAPLLEATRRIDRTFGGLGERIGAATAVAKQTIGNYERAKRAAAEAARRRAIEDAEAEQARQRAAAEAAYAANDLEAHKDAVFAAEMAVAAPVPAPAKVAGVTLVERWHAEVTSLGELVAAAAQNPDLLQYLHPVMPLLNKVAVAHHGAVTIPGVEMVREEGVSMR